MAETSRREFLASAASIAALGGMTLGFGPAANGQGQPSDKSLGKPEEKGRGAAIPLEKRQFGSTDMKVTVLGFGGAEIGFSQTDKDTVAKILNSALDAGLNVIDTAECYAGSEEVIGVTVSGRRNEYFLFTKVGHVDGWGKPEGWTTAGIEKSIERSLQRLKTDHVDLVQLHSCGKDVLEKGECIEALEKAKKAGKTRYIGYSGDSEAALYAVESGKFDALQTSVSFADQEAIELTLPKAIARKMGVIAKRPIANAVWRNEADPKGNNGAYWNRMQKMDLDFTKGDARTAAGPEGAAGVALRFTLSVPGVHVAIVGTTKPERWRENAELLRAGGPLSKERYEAIRAKWKQAAEPGWHGQT